MRNIFMYWETPPGGSKPAYLNLCLQTVEYWKGEFELNILDEVTVHDFLPGLRPEVAGLSLNHKSDYFRSRLVHRYGGIWLDADVIAMKPLDELLGFLDNDVAAFYGRGRSNLSANCFAAHPGSSVLAEWMRLQDQALDGEASIPWNGLGKGPLVEATTDSSYAVIPFNRIAPIRWQKWRLLLSKWRSPRRYLRDDPIVFMLYNKFLHDAFDNMSADQILEGDMLISKLFRIALGMDEADG